MCNPQKMKIIATVRWGERWGLANGQFQAIAGTVLQTEAISRNTDPTVKRTLRVPERRRCEFTVRQ